MKKSSILERFFIWTIRLDPDAIIFKYGSRSGSDQYTGSATPALAFNRSTSAYAIEKQDIDY